MNTIVIIIHFSACFMLIIAVLLQGGKSSAMGVFGGGGGDALFASSSGTNFIKKFTLAMAIVIACTSLMLTVFGKRARSVMDKYANTPAAPAQSQPVGNTSAPAQTAAPAAQQPPQQAPAKTK